MIEYLVGDYYDGDDDDDGDYDYGDDGDDYDYYSNRRARVHHAPAPTQKKQKSRKNGTTHKGHKRIKPVSPCSPSKAGKCGSFGDSAFNCDASHDYCQDDCDCPGHQKCCGNSCGRRECLPAVAVEENESRLLNMFKAIRI